VVGHAGVLLFFVHTALVLMLSLDRTPGHRRALNFYIRRIFRIYPLSIVCVALVLLFHVPRVPDGMLEPWTWQDIVTNFLLVQNLFRHADILAPLWSLPRECQMYLALPFFYLLLKKFSSSVVVLLLWVVFFAAVPHAPLLESFPCFMGGVFAYQLGKEKTFRLPGAAWPALLAALLGLYVLSMMSPFADFDRNDFVLCMFLGAVIPNIATLKKSAVTASCHTIAKYSYGIYLCHDPVLWFSFVKLGALPAGVQWTALVTLMAAIPVAAYHLLEAPMIGVGRRVAQRWSTQDAAPVLQSAAAVALPLAGD
jgi:peptidoglycan/LPS O-acetylase OafA/YrhL